MNYVIKDGLFFIRSPRRNRKYRVYIDDKLYFDFGDTRYMHYRDDVSDIYKNLNHYDIERRERYYKRHPVDYSFPSPDWFSKYYLWRKD